jgi:thiol-disulfide isomerase/thioredoxin
MPVAQFFSRRYMPVRASILAVLGAATVLVARANHISAQSPPVKVVRPPELVGTTWINTPTPITLASRRGQVTLVDFWTFACSNCRANLPACERWQQRYASRGFTIIGIHTPEIPIEYKVEKVREFVKQQGITYPVVLDNDYRNWNRWDQDSWPALYLIDKQGRVREKWVGELNSMGSGGEAKLTKKIEELLAEGA